MSDSGSVVAAFSEDNVVRLTGIPKGRLRYWDKTGFFVPSLADENRRRAYSRVYSFRDLLCLRVLSTIRIESRVPLQHLRDVKVKLAHLGDDMWATTTLYVLNRRVVFYNPETDRREDAATGQGVLQIPLQVVWGDMEKAVKDLWTRDGATMGRVEHKRGVASNNPVIAGTRISVKAIRAFHDAGFSIDKIREEYPVLSDEDVKAALTYSEAA